MPKIDRNLRRHIRRLKKQLVLKQNFKCEYCFAPITLSATFDHKIPKSKGGPDTIENGVACCGECNTAKADMTYDEFIYRLTVDIEPLFFLVRKCRRRREQYQKFYEYEAKRKEIYNVCF